MKPSTYNVDQEKWHTFSPGIQLKNIVAEVTRAAAAGLHKKHSEDEREQGAYERALALINASLADSQWEDKDFLYQLRDALAALYVGEPSPAITYYIANELLERSMHMG